MFQLKKAVAITLSSNCYKNNFRKKNKDDIKICSHV